MLKIKLKDASSLLDMSSVEKLARESAPVLERVKAGEQKYRTSLGWHDVEEWAGEAWLSRYEELAARVKAEADVLVVIGVGGSNQAARAVYEALEPAGGVELVWAGNSISAHSINDVLKQIQGKRVMIDVIAKNFETLEPGIGFRALRAWLRREYGADYAKHVICTGTPGASLEALCTQEGYAFLPFPEDIGGRFTALSPVGLFPLCCAGADIRAIARGAAEMRRVLMETEGMENPALYYAAVRNQLDRQGFRVEMLSFFEPRFFRFAKWWTQLYGESEGKDDKGLFPVFGNFSEDLHSLGQFIQDGTRVVFETFLDVQEQDASLVLDGDLADGFGYLDGWDFFRINKAAFQATVQAHSRRFPCLVMEVERMDEACFGQLFYFFEFACYLSGEILGVNPFDQPGVEAYKTDMFKILGK